MMDFQLVVLAVLSITAVCTVGQNQDYKINVNNLDNAIRAECVQRDGLETPVMNPTWYLNGASIGESSCLSSSTLNGNELSFTITPNCEGYLQCSSGVRCSLPQRVYAYPTLITDGPMVNRIIAMPGSDVVFPCYLTVSAFNNFEVCWFFSFNVNNRMEFSCNTELDYSLRLSMVANSNIGTYQCEAIANATADSGLQPNSPQLIEKGPNIMLVLFEPVQLSGEIEASFENGMYQFSAPLAQGTPPYTYKWFINNTEDPAMTTDSTLTTSYTPNTVLVSVSNQDQSDTTFTVNRTALIVNSMVMCPTVSPTNLPPVSPVTLDTIVPAVLLAVFVVLGFLAIFSLLFIAFYFYNRKCDLQQEFSQEMMMKEQSLDEKKRQISELKEKNRELREEKGDLQHQISAGSDITDGFSNNSVGLQFAKIAMDIKNHCPSSCSAKFYLEVVTNIMNCMSQHCNDKRFRKLVRGVRDDAIDLFDALVEEDHQEPSDCGDSIVCTDDVPDLEDAKAQFQHSLQKLNDILETETEE